MNIQIPYFDNATAELEKGEHSSHPALLAFLALNTDDRLADSRHVYAYYRDFHHSVGGEGWLDDEMGVPESPEDIWKYVSPRHMFLKSDREDQNLWYVFIDADCGWEEEHGLIMVWRNGKTLCKVGGFDDHPTNSHSYADQSQDEVVYDGEAEFRTYMKSGFGA